MRAYSLSHLSDPELSRGLASLVVQDRVTTATLLAHIAEFDARRLYLPAACPSMYAYCVHELRLSEDAAYKRITAARLAREFPAIFECLADGRLHLAGVVLLAPYLTQENAADLLGAAAHRTKSEIEELIARRFPRTEEIGLVLALPGSASMTHMQLAPGQVETGSECPGACAFQLAPGQVGSECLGTPAAQLAPGRVEACGAECLGASAGQLAPAQVGPRSKLAPIAHDRFLLQLTIGQSTQDKLRYAQNLLGHQLPSGDLAQVLDRALDVLIEKLERRKFAATSRPRRSTRPSTNPRHIPAQVKRAVWERDGGQCTFVSEPGHRCPARKFLEFDHVEEVARGGRATVGGIRLRCRAHNQYGAECAFGAEFIRYKREAARRAAAVRRHEAEARTTDQARRLAAETRARASDEARAAEARARVAAEEVITPLRLLGFPADQARRAAALCEAIPEASLEQRLRRALAYFHPRLRTSTQAVPT